MPRAGRKASSERTSCNCMLLHKGRFWSSNSFLEGQCLVYWSDSPYRVKLGVWGLPPERCTRTKLSIMPENSPSEEGEMERIRYEGQSKMSTTPENPHLQDGRDVKSSV